MSINVSITCDFYKNRPEIIDFLPKSYSKVLEIGCAEGYFAQNLLNECETWGIEPVQEYAEEASKVFRKVLTGTYQSVFDMLPDNYFDLVICNDVIEHMTNTEYFFQSIKQKMKKDSCIVGSIPNVRYFSTLYRLIIKKNWEYEDYGILDKTHLRFFTEKSIKNIISKNGFVIEKFHGINPGITKLRNMKARFSNFLIWFIGFFSFGYFNDIRFMQFGFRIKIK